jgi:hypothetical protein
VSVSLVFVELCQPHNHPQQQRILLVLMLLPPPPTPTFHHPEEVIIIIIINNIDSVSQTVMVVAWILRVVGNLLPNLPTVSMKLLSNILPAPPSSVPPTLHHRRGKKVHQRHRRPPPDTKPTSASSWNKKKRLRNNSSNRVVSLRDQMDLLPLRQRQRPLQRQLHQPFLLLLRQRQRQQIHRRLLSPHHHPSCPQNSKE